MIPGQQPQQPPPAPQQQHQQQPGTQSSSEFQPFAHGLPQLRTSVMHSPAPLCPPSPSQSLASPHTSLQAPASAASIHSLGASSHQSADMAHRLHSNGNVFHALHAPPGRPHTPLPGVAASGSDRPGLGLSVSSQSPSSSGRGSFDGHQPAASAVEEEASTSTFHLPTGLAEQLSDSHQISFIAGMPAQEQQHQLPVAELHHAAASAYHVPPSAASSAQLPSQSKAKLRSPPGFSRPLDGAAKPFVPSNSAWPPAGDRQHTNSLRQPPGMSVASLSLAAAGSLVNGRSIHTHSQSSSSTVHAKRGQQHANLATGQWAMASQEGKFSAHVSTSLPFDHVSGDSNFASNASSHDSWQVPIMHAKAAERDDSEAALASLLDSEHDKTSGLAPHDVLDFLGIGMSEERTSSMSQPVT